MKKPMLINLELTSKCNYQCITCLSNEQRKQLGCYDMSRKNIDIFTERVKECFQQGVKVQEIINAGYGESVLSKNYKYAFTKFAELKKHIHQKYKKDLKVSMVTNGYALHNEKLKDASGGLDIIKFSIPSSIPKRYAQVTLRNTNTKVFEQVVKNIRLCMKHNLYGTLPELRFHISPPCRISNEDTDVTIIFLAGIAREIGLKEINVVTFPNTSNRGGLVNNKDVFHDEVFYKKKKVYNKAVVNGVRINMLSEFNVFYPSYFYVLQLLKQKFPCMWQNGSITIDAGGNYRFCINDVMGQNVQGNLKDLSLTEMDRRIKKTGPVSQCHECNENPYFMGGDWVSSLYSYFARNLHRLHFKRVHEGHNKNSAE